jgi:PAS domain S-box-containing protein
VSRPAAQYAVAVAGVVVVTLLRIPFEGVLHGRAPYALYYLPIVLTAWYCGVAATVVAIALSLVSAWFLFATGGPGHLASFVVFFIVSAAMVFFARAARETRQTTEEALAAARRSFEANAYLASIVASSDDAILSKNLDGIIQSCNAAAERLFGYSARELIGSPVTVLLPPDRLTEETEILARLRRGERVDHFETVRIAKDGHPIDLSLTISPVRDASGEIIGASKIARDITERKRAAAALAEQREWFRVTLSSIGDAVIAAAADGTVSFLNDVAASLTGWPQAQAVGRPMVEVFHIVNEQTRQLQEDPTAKVLRTGRVQGLANHTLLIRRDGSEIPIADSAAPILDDGGRVIGVVLVFRDISSRRDAETERNAAAMERERLLESERSARAAAERASQSKDDFLATVSHELRTPLNAILGWSRMLSERLDDPVTLRHGLEVIERNTRLQAQLISDILDVSRIVSGKLRLEMQETDLVTLVDQALQTVRPAADVKKISLGRTLEVPSAITFGDPARLQQCIWNLLSNAIKFTPEGGRVRVTLRRAGDQAEISVSDNGMGIGREFLPFVFDRFRQAETSATRQAGGLGLGLAIVKQLVELHGGHIHAESAGPGQGSHFTLTIPLTATPERRLERVRDSEEEHAVLLDGTSLRGVKVLVVEDDADTRELVQHLLEGQGASVLTAGTATEALSLLERAGADILVSDIALPELDGYQLVRRVRQGSEPARSIPAIALTAYTRSEDRTKALRAGYQAHVQKPVEPAELLAAISSFSALIGKRRKPESITR